MEKEILYKIVLDWYNATVVGADGFDEEWDEVCDSIEYKLNEKIERGYIETVEELIEAGKELIGKELGDREALKFEKIAKDSYDPYDFDNEYEQIVKDSLKEGSSKMKSYKFEIWWNTGDWYWDNEPDIEFFNGTIDQLNDYINGIVKDMHLEHIGWEDEPADINEEDIRELKSTGRLQKCEGNVVWMLHSVEDLIKESKKRLNLNEGLFGTSHPTLKEFFNIENFHCTSKTKFCIYDGDKEDPDAILVVHGDEIIEGEEDVQPYLNQVIDYIDFDALDKRVNICLMTQIKESRMRVNEGLFDPKPWSAKGIEKAKKVKQLPPHRYSVHMTSLNVEQLFGLLAMNNIKNGIELFGFGIAKIEGRYYIYRWHPTEYNWAHPKMGRNKLTKQSSEIELKRLSVDFTDEMADDLCHWIKDREFMGVSSGRVWPIFNFKNYGEVYEGIMVFGNNESSIRKYKKLYDKLIAGRNALPLDSGNYTGQVSEIPNNFQMGSYLSVDLDPEEIMSLGIGQIDIRDETTRKPYGEVTLDESEESFPGLSKYMKRDVENIFNHNPDMSMDYFLNTVTGEGDDGYDPECAAIMWEYYEYLQSR